jgi:hypothetical protein
MPRGTGAWRNGSGRRLTVQRLSHTVDTSRQIDGKELSVIRGYRGTLIALAARAPLNAELVVVAAGFTANISGQAHIAWHFFVLCGFDVEARADPSTREQSTGEK